MKSVFGIIFMATLLLGCTSSSRVLQTPAENIIDLSQNEEEYELIVLDPGFATWFTTSWNLAKDRSVDYYSHWNYRYASEWNYKATRPHTSEFFDSIIQYDPTADYGIEVERKLYYYFRWVETRLGIPILGTQSPGAI
jgi:hypothetical protein